MKIVNCIL